MNPTTEATQATAYPHIVKIPGVCGGAAIIEGTRIAVWHIVNYYYNLGMAVEAILADWDYLKPAQVFSALAYYHDNREEIDHLRHSNTYQYYQEHYAHVVAEIAQKVEAPTTAVLKPSPPSREPGSAVGQIIITEDFDTPLPEAIKENNMETQKTNLKDILDWESEQFPIVYENQQPKAVLVDIATFRKLTLLLDNLLRRDPEPEDALLAESETLTQLVDHVKKTAQATADWEQELYAL
jgi:uncharacterized protein (DUF433 family)